MNNILIILFLIAKDNIDTSSKVASLTNNTNNIPSTGETVSKNVDWPQVPQIGAVNRSACMSNMHCDTFNNIASGAAVTNNSFNDVNDKLDQVLGK